MKFCYFDRKEIVLTYCKTNKEVGPRPQKVESKKIKINIY